MIYKPKFNLIQTVFFELKNWMFFTKIGFDKSLIF